MVMGCYGFVPAPRSGGGGLVPEASREYWQTRQQGPIVYRYAADKKNLSARSRPFGHGALPRGVRSIGRVSRASSAASLRAGPRGGEHTREHTHPLVRRSPAHANARATPLETSQWGLAAKHARLNAWPRRASEETSSA